MATLVAKHFTAPSTAIFTTTTATLTGIPATTPGNLAILIVGIASGMTLTTPTGWSNPGAHASVLSTVFAEAKLQVFYRTVGSSYTSVSVDSDNTTAQFGFLAHYEFSGMDTADAWEAGNSATSGTVSGSVTPAGTSNLVMAIFGDADADQVTNNAAPGSDWDTADALDQNYFVVTFKLNVTGAQSHTVGGTGTLSGAHLIHAFNGAAAAGLPFITQLTGQRIGAR